MFNSLLLVMTPLLEGRGWEERSVDCRGTYTKETRNHTEALSSEILITREILAEMAITSPRQGWDG